MRTTLNIEDEAVLVIKKYAEAREIPLGQAVSELVYRGMENLPYFETKNGWVVFERPSGSPALTSQLVDEYEKNGHDEEYELAFSPRR